MPRLAFYCHNVHGLGHIIRTALVAGAAHAAGARCLLVTGCSALDRLALPPGVEVTSLPALLFRNDTYVAADGTRSAMDVMRDRAAQIVERLRAFRPHVLVADHTPLGLAGELLPALSAARQEGWPTRWVLGLPYPEGTLVARRLPPPPREQAAVAAYSAVLAYVPEEQSFLHRLADWVPVATRVATGFVADAPLPAAPAEPRGLVVVAAGGGSTAPDLCRLALAARRRLPVDSRPPMRLLSGPLSDVADLRRTTVGAADEGVSWIAHGHLKDLVRDAAVVVSRAGYNSAAFLLQTRLPLVFVPTVGASGDQLVRAASWPEWPGVRVVPPDAGDPEASLAGALAEAATIGVVAPRLVADGAVRAARWLIEWAAGA